MERKRSDVKRSPSGAAVRQPAVTEALHRALFREWAAQGYRALSLERVAGRAGVGKAALYRRWPSKAAMVSDALRTVGLSITDASDTGSLEGDIRALLRSFRRVLRHPLARRILPDLHAERGRSDELDAVLAPFTAARRERGMALIDRAIARGELAADIDVELALDLLAAPIYWRMIVTRGAADVGYLDRAAHGLATALTAQREIKPRLSS